MKLTKREKIVAVVMGILILLIFIIPPNLLKDEYEYLWLFIVVIPIGILIATDPERRK